MSGPKASGSREPKHITPSGEPVDTFSRISTSDFTKRETSPKKASSPAIELRSRACFSGPMAAVDGAGRQHIDAAHRHALGRVGIGLDGQGDEIDVQELGQLVGHDMDHLLEGRGLDDADHRRLDAVLDDLVLLELAMISVRSFFRRSISLRRRFRIACCMSMTPGPWTRG
jgi:hypothetical protein